jgi:hypothetical protein
MSAVPGFSDKAECLRVKRWQLGVRLRDLVPAQRAKRAKAQAEGGVGLVSVVMIYPQ